MSGWSTSDGVAAEPAGRLKVGVLGLTGCAGDQLQILNCESELLALTERVEFADWSMLRSGGDHRSRLDVGFVEGVVATARDLDALRDVRERADLLVAIGTCAVFGGLPAMRNRLPPETLAAGRSFGDRVPVDAPEARPATDFVPFDLELPGCPIERGEFLRTIQALLAGTRPELPRVPVCQECKSREIVCRVVHFGEVCCGAMTRGGCGARCPSHGVACAGCRGPVEEPNYDANITMFRGRGLSWMDIAARMERFSAPVWMKLALEREAKRADES